MRLLSAFWRVVVVNGAVLSLGGSAGAQVPIPSSPAEINACLCLQQAAATLAADKDSKAQTLATVDRQLADLDAQLAAERPRVDVNNPDSVSRYKALLERRDAAFRQVSPTQADAARAVARYNATVNEYNQRCTRLPIDPGLAAAMQAHLNCPPLQ